MTKEILRQGDLFTSQLIESISPCGVEARAREAADIHADSGPQSAPDISTESVQGERPRATLRDIRAVRSLLYNRLLLEVVQRRIEKAETIILSYLLTQGSTTAQIGPYWVELDATDHICLTRTETDDDWRQLYFSEVDAVAKV